MDIWKESEILEFKETTGELKEAVISMSSILNKHGKGELYFGIKNDGTVKGQQIGSNTLRDVSKAISDNLKPQVFPVINAITIEDKRCIRLEFEGNDPPYFAYDRVYIRVADEDKKLSPSELEEFYRRKIEQVSNWDSSPADIAPSDIDEDVLKKYIGKANAVGRLDYEYSTKEDVLTKLGLLTASGISNAAEVMFGKAPRLEEQMAIFATEEKLTFNDIANVKGRIIDLVDAAEKYIRNNMHFRVVIDGTQMERKEIPEVPIVAIREALYNSWCHRAFRVPQNNEVAIFSNRIEIYNPGTFPAGVTPQDFISGSEKSIHRNPLLAQIMYYSKDVERFGTGLKRIADACNEAGIKYEFISGKYGFTVVFYRPPLWTSDNLDENLNGALKNAPVNAPVNETVNAPVNKTERQILERLKDNDRYTFDELASVIGVNRSTISRNMKSLREKGVVERIGSDRLGHWEISETI